MERIGVIGAGAWGTALAMAARRAGREVVLWARDPGLAKEIEALIDHDGDVDAALRTTLAEASGDDVAAAIHLVSLMRRAAVVEQQRDRFADVRLWLPDPAQRRLLADGLSIAIRAGMLVNEMPVDRSGRDAVDARAGVEDEPPEVEPVERGADEGLAGRCVPELELGGALWI